MRYVKHATTLLVLLAHLSGCMAHKPPDVHQPRPGVVGVAQLPRAPERELDVGPRGTLSGAAVGAGKGALSMMGASPSCSGGHDCLVAAAVSASFIVGGAVVGGVVGAIRAVPAETAEQMESQLGSALGAVDQQAELRTAVVAAARARGENVMEIGTALPTGAGRPMGDGALAAPDVDTALEVGVVQVALVGSGGSDPELRLHVLGVARLVDVRTNLELYRNAQLERVSEPRKLSEWSADDGRVLKEEIGRGRDAVAAAIVEAVWPGVPVGQPSQATAGSPG